MALEVWVRRNTVLSEKCLCGSRLWSGEHSNLDLNLSHEVVTKLRYRVFRHCHILYGRFLSMLLLSLIMDYFDRALAILDFNLVLRVLVDVLLKSWIRTARQLVATDDSVSRGLTLSLWDHRISFHSHHGLILPKASAGLTFARLLLFAVNTSSEHISSLQIISDFTFCKRRTVWKFPLIRLLTIQNQ